MGFNLLRRRSEKDAAESKKDKVAKTETPKKEVKTPKKPFSFFKSTPKPKAAPKGKVTPNSKAASANVAPKAAEDVKPKDEIEAGKLVDEAPKTDVVSDETKPVDEVATDAAAEPANESEEKPKDETDETDGDDAQANQTNVTTEETPESVDRDYDEDKDAAVSDENAEPKVAGADRSTEEGVEKKGDQAQQPWAVCCGILGPL